MTTTQRFTCLSEHKYAAITTLKKSLLHQVFTREL